MKHAPLTRHTFWLLLLIPLFLGSCTKDAASKPEQSYWVWKATDLAWVPEDALLYLYQGDYRLHPGQPVFIKRGLQPDAHLAQRAPVLLIRVYQREDPQELAFQLAYLVNEWQTRGALIEEIQLDHDSPSSQLADYAHFVQALKTELANEDLSLSVSVTGLATWLADNPKGLAELAKASSYIHFQLYSHYQPLPQLPDYLRRLDSYPFPYMLGITTAPAFQQMEFATHAQYRGTTVFLNK